MQPPLPDTTEISAPTVPLTPDEFLALTRRLGRTSSRADTLYSVVGCSGMAAFSIAVSWSLIIANILPVLIATVAGGIVALMLYAFTVRAREDKREVERLLKFLNETQDAAMLGPILALEMTTLHLGGIRTHIAQARGSAVMRLLPHIQAHHADALSREQRLQLDSYIWEDVVFLEKQELYNLPHVRAMLPIMEQIGNKSDLPQIESLLSAANVTEEFRAAVQHCLDVVRERAAREEGKDVLLRPERKPEAAGTLLRPSAERQDTPPEQLLRATNAADGDTPA